MMCGRSGLEALIISGTPTEEQLSRAWDEILQEYSDITMSERGSTVFDVWKKILYTQFKIAYVEHAIEILKKRWDKNVAERLVEVGFDYVVYKEDRDEYMKQIEAVEIESGILIVQLNQYTAEYKLLCPDDNSTTATRTEIDYEKELAILSKWFGSRIKKEEITVFEMGGIIAAYNEYHKTK